MARRRLLPAGLLLGPVILLGAAACGGDDDDATAGTSPSPTSVASGVVTSPTVASSVAALDVDDACALVPAADVRSVTDLAVDDGVPAGDERRRVCTFQVPDLGVGITVGVEAGGRFDEKAEASRRSLGVDGDEIDDVGDSALFFFSDEDLPEGVGGVLVGVGDVTVDVTLQGLDEDELRHDALAIAELAVGNL